MASKNILIVMILILNLQIYSESLAVVFSGSNNGYFRDCG
jgi:hypothetical protein